jgi:hypothetical protein
MNDGERVCRSARHHLRAKEEHGRSHELPSRHHPGAEFATPAQEDVTQYHTAWRSIDALLSACAQELTRKTTEPFVVLLPRVIHDVAQKRTSTRRATS